MRNTGDSVLTKKVVINSRYGKEVAELKVVADSVSIKNNVPYCDDYWVMLDFNTNSKFFNALTGERPGGIVRDGEIGLGKSSYHFGGFYNHREKPTIILSGVISDCDLLKAECVERAEKFMNLAIKELKQRKFNNAKSAIKLLKELAFYNYSDHFVLSEVETIKKYNKKIISFAKKSDWSYSIEDIKPMRSALKEVGGEKSKPIEIVKKKN